MTFLASSARFAKQCFSGSARIRRWFVKGLVPGFIIRLRERPPSLHASAPWCAWVTLRLAASAGLLLCLVILWLVVPSVIEALRSPDPGRGEGFVVLLIVAWVGCDALRYGRLAISRGVRSQLREL